MSIMSATRAQNSCQVKSVAGIVPKNVNCWELAEKTYLAYRKEKGRKGASKEAQGGVKAPERGLQGNVEKPKAQF